MDLGLLGTADFFPGQTNFLSLNSDHPQLKEMLEANSGSHGYGSTKQDRPDPVEHDVFRASKMTKWADDLGLRSSDNVFPQQQLLSFSSSSSTPEFSFLTGNDVESIEGKNPQNVPFSYYQHQSGYPNCSSGFGSENMNVGMHCSLTGTRGSFTPAQWIELEHQTMIYKYICANVPVPSNLLNSIRKQLTSSGFPGYFSVGSYPTNSYGWGPFQLGFDRTDLEPERCRRTDGKKWRCSKDAVPDHKYCEKHVKKGRARSRKPVECQTGQAVGGPASSKGVPPVSLPPISAPLGASSDRVSNCVTNAQNQNRGSQRDNGIFNHESLSGMNPAMNSKSKNSPFSIPKHQNPMDELINTEFGLVSNNSLLNPSDKPFDWSSKNYNPFLFYDPHKHSEDHGSSKDDVSPQLVSSSPSPTGVLQKSSFVSLSNNSSGACSPRGENTNTTEGVSLYEDLLGSAQRLIARSSSIPFG